jgi:hypothetical protein
VAGVRLERCRGGEGHEEEETEPAPEDVNATSPARRR